MACDVSFHSRYVLVKSSNEITREDGDLLAEFAEMSDVWENLSVCVFDFSSLEKVHALSIRPLIIGQSRARKHNVLVTVYLNNQKTKDYLLSKGAIRESEICTSSQHLWSLLRRNGHVEEKE